MLRLFVALRLPDDVAQQLMLIQSGVPGARWQTHDQLHLTLRFIGEVDGVEASAVDEALTSVSVARFPVALHSVGQFGNRRPHTLWAGVRQSEPLLHLQQKVEAAIQRAGRPAERHKYIPHVTLARLRLIQPGRLIDYLTQHALFSSRAFDVESFVLYSSKLTSDGSIYRAEQIYSLC